MSDNNTPAIYATPQVKTLKTSKIGVGYYVVNDYLLTVTEDSGGNGYLFTIRKGSQEQVIHLTELSEEAVNAAIEEGLASAKESGEFDGNGISSASFDPETSSITLYFTDGSSFTTGSIKGDTGAGIESATMNPDYTITFTTTDGNSYTVGPVRGEKGNGIESVRLNLDYTLTFITTDGEVFTTGSVRGPKGDTGNGIKNITFNDDYTLTFTLTDDSTYTTESVRGEKGEVGNGIASSTINEDYTLTLKFTDGTSYTTIPLRGAKGDQGEKGDPGESFGIHICSSTEYDATTRIPTVPYPKSNILYLVPAKNEPDNDLFVEWVYIYGAWEMFGSATIDVHDMATKEDLNLKLDKPSREGFFGQFLVSDGAGGSTWNDPTIPDWTAGTGAAGYIRNKPDLKVGTGNDSVTNRHSIASGYRSFAIGTNNTANGTNSFTSGESNTAGAVNSFAIGNQNTVGGSSSFSSGRNNRVLGSNSLASGYNNVASSAAAETAVFGYKNTVDARDSVVGGSNNTVGNVINVGVVGSSNTVSGTASDSFVSGTGNTVSGASSHAEGYGTVASHRSQHTFGEYNSADESIAAGTARGNYIEIVGNGTADNARSNARTLDWSGNEWIKGNLKIGGSSYDDPNAKELATKEYVDEHAGTGSVTDVKINGTSIVDSETGEAEIPYGTTTKPGVAKYNVAYGVEINGGFLKTVSSSDDQIKAGAEKNRPLVPYKQHTSTFYGLAKAAGDTTQSQSANAVGTYTEDAKAAIKAMLGVIDPESKVVTVTGTDPVIQAEENTRYMCGEVLSLSFTPSASGICEVIFTAGSTLPVITLPQTVKMPEWFEIETDHTYDISIVDGVYGAVMVW